MELLRLPLAVKRDAWRPSGYYESKQQAWSKIRTQILERDKFCCQACGFSCSKYQEVHHLDSDHDNNHPDNLITLCPLCHATQHIGLAGIEGKATLIWLPEMPQATLFHTIRWFELGPYVRPEVVSFIKTSKEQMYNFFKDRERMCQLKIGTSDPGALGNMLVSLTDEQYEKDVCPKIQSVRLMPKLSAYNNDILRAWEEQLTEIIPKPENVSTYLDAGRKNTSEKR